MTHLSTNAILAIIEASRKRKEAVAYARSVKVIYFEKCIMRKAYNCRCSELASETCKNYETCNDIAIKLNWPGWKLITKEEADGLHSKTFHRTIDGTVQEAKETCPMGSEGTPILGNRRPVNQTSGNQGRTRNRRSNRRSDFSKYWSTIGEDF
jgi:hypothetical protein